jgi:hypothetical protein
VSFSHAPKTTLNAKAQVSCRGPARVTWFIVWRARAKEERLQSRQKLKRPPRAQCSNTYISIDAQLSARPGPLWANTNTQFKCTSSFSQHMTGSKHFIFRAAGVFYVAANYQVRVKVKNGRSHSRIAYLSF